MQRREFIAGLAGAVVATRAAAEDYPSHPVRILVPYSAGGTSDTASRLIVDALAKQLGQSVYVEDRAGAGGLNATEALFNLAPDGYTLLLTGAGPVAIIPPVKSVNYDVEKDMVPLGSIWRSPQVLATSTKLGVTSMADFIARAKANPGGITIGSAGIGALTHLSIELLQYKTGIALTHVPFRSTGGTLPALIGGQIDATFGDVALLAPHVEERSIVALAIAAEHRSPLLPGLVTMREAGVPGVEVENWYGLVVSSRTAAPIVARLKAAVLAAQNDAAYRANLERQGVTAGEPAADSFGRLIKSEIAKWAPVVRMPGFRLD